MEDANVRVCQRRDGLGFALEAASAIGSAVSWDRRILIATMRFKRVSRAL